MHTLPSHTQNVTSPGAGSQCAIELHPGLGAPSGPLWPCDLYATRHRLQETQRRQRVRNGKTAMTASIQNKEEWGASHTPWRPPHSCPWAALCAHPTARWHVTCHLLLQTRLSAVHGATCSCFLLFLLWPLLSLLGFLFILLTSRSEGSCPPPRRNVVSELMASRF